MVPVGWVSVVAGADADVVAAASAGLVAVVRLGLAAVPAVEPADVVLSIARGIVGQSCHVSQHQRRAVAVSFGFAGAWVVGLAWACLAEESPSCSVGIEKVIWRIRLSRELNECFVWQ